MTCMPTTRDGYMATVGRFLWEQKIEPQTCELAAVKGGRNPFDPKPAAPKRSDEQALRDFVAGVRAGSGSRRGMRV